MSRIFFKHTIIPPSRHRVPDGLKVHGNYAILDSPYSERCILVTAKKYKNKITLVDVIRECGIDSHEAEKILTEFTRRGIADMRITKNGNIYYVFQDAESIEMEG